MIDLRDRGEINDETLREVERELDLEELRMEDLNTSAAFEVHPVKGTMVRPRPDVRPPGRPDVLLHVLPEDRPVGDRPRRRTAAR